MRIPETTPKHLIPSPYTLSHGRHSLLSFKSQQVVFPLPTPQHWLVFTGHFPYINLTPMSAVCRRNLKQRDKENAFFRATALRSCSAT